MKAKKSLGQHFLKSERALATIVEAANLDKSDTVLEIGPGHGALTEKLLEKAGRVVAVEKDDELFLELKEKFREANFEPIHGDILDLEIDFKNYKLVANIPYNITGAIIRKFLSSTNQPKKMVLLVQKEVGDRIVAKDGKESILSLSVKAYGNPKIIEKVLAGSFAPAPKVDSAIISIEDISKNFFDSFSEEKFFALLRTGFASKRKKLVSNLGNLLGVRDPKEVFNKMGLDENLRAEDLDLLGWKKLASNLYKP